MNAISIKAALTSLFALMILMIGGLGYMTITRIGGVNENVVEFAQNWLPSIDTLGQINANFGDIRYLEGEHSLSATPDEMGSKEKKLAAVEDRIQDEFGRL